ncbi:MAG: GyrI-like domain-containing protein, partial [Pseudomonas sp.]
RGSPTQLDQSVQQFIQWRMHSGQSPVAASRTFGIPYTNPDTTPAEEFRFAICGEIADNVAPNSIGIHEVTIPGGRYVVVRHAGSPDHIGESIYPVFRDWLPTSGEELRDQPLFFHYLSIYPPTPLEQWQTDVYIPLNSLPE